MLDSHPGYPPSKIRAVDTITSTESVSWCALEGEGFDDLLGGPLRCRMFRSIERHDAATRVGPHDEDRENAKGGGGHSQEINCYEIG